MEFPNIKHVGDVSKFVEAKDAPHEYIMFYKDAEYLERLNIAVLDCYINGLCTARQRNAMTKNLINKAMKALELIKTEEE